MLRAKCMNPFNSRIFLESTWSSKVGEEYVLTPNIPQAGFTKRERQECLDTRSGSGGENQNGSTWSSLPKSFSDADKTRWKHGTMSKYNTHRPIQHPVRIQTRMFWRGTVHSGIYVVLLSGGKSVSQLWRGYFVLNGGWIIDDHKYERLTTLGLHWNDPCKLEGNWFLWFLVDYQSSKLLWFGMGESRRGKDVRPRSSDVRKPGCSGWS